MTLRNYDDLIKITPKKRSSNKHTIGLLHKLRCDECANLSVSDTLLVVLLHTRYLTYNHISILDICSINSSHTLLSRLKKKGYIQAFTVTNNISYKYYVLTQKGFDHISSILGNEYLADNNLSYKPTRQTRNKYIAHSLASLDIYCSMLSNAIITSINWKNELEAHATTGTQEGQTLFRHDAFIDVALTKKEIDQETVKNGIWLEQDMSTESPASLKVKFGRMAEKLKDDNRYTPYSILFTINVERHITKSLLNEKYSKIPNIKSLPFFNEILNLLKKNSYDQLAQLSTLLINATPKEKSLLKLVNTLATDHITTKEELETLTKEITSNVEYEKKHILDNLYATKYSQRRNKVLNLLLNNTSPLLHSLHNGLDFYIVSNRKIKSFTNNEYLSPAPAYIKARKLIFARLLNEDVHNFSYAARKKITDKNKIFYVRHYYEVLKNNNKLTFSIEEYYNNVGAGARVHRLIENISANTPLILLIITNDVNEAIEVAKRTKSHRFIKPNGSILGKFAVYYTSINGLYDNTAPPVLYTINNDGKAIIY